MQIALEHIDANKASNYLNLNLHNRTLRPKRVRQYAEQMRQGKWLETGDPIRFSTTGRLLDGQHRLAAIIAADVTIQAIVIREVDDSVFPVLDSGLARTPSDAMAAGHITDGQNKAATIRQLLVYEMGGDSRMSVDLIAVTRMDIAEYYANQVIELEDATYIGRRMYNAFAGGNRAAWTAFAMLANRVSPKHAEEFFNGVLSGVNLPAGDPRLALRNWLANGRKMPAAGFYLAMFIKCWNAWVKGETRKTMILRDDEAFPTLVAPTIR